MTSILLPRHVALAVVVSHSICLMATVGCSDGSGLPRTVPVSGKVTYKGAAVDGATVSFIGDGNIRLAVAITLPDGSYSLKTLDADGAMPGKYSVVVEKTELPPELTKEVSMEEAAKMAGRPPPAPKRLLPAKYGDATKTPFRFEVKDGGPNQFDLPLTD